MTDFTDFDDYLAATFGDDLDAFLSHPESPDFIRVNPLRATPEEVVEALEGYGIQLAPHPISPLVFQIVDQDPENPIGTCLHHFMGWFRIQSLGSMIPPIVLAPEPGDDVVDMCAAPGSKTTQLAAMMKRQGLLVANDVSGRRMNQLCAATDAAGVFNVVATSMDGARLPNVLSRHFDRVLADVPGTGLGTRLNLDSNRERFEARGRPSTLPFAQYALSVGATRLVKAGGRIVYSTCSLTTEENEAVLDGLLQRFPIRLLEIDDLPGLYARPGHTDIHGDALNPELSKARRITPWENPTEGFFVALLEVTGELPERHARDPELEVPRTPTLPWDHDEIRPAIENASAAYRIPAERFQGLRYRHHKDKIYAFEGHIEDFWDDAHRAGTGMLRRRGAHWRLSHTGVQRFSDVITRNVVTVDDEQFRKLIQIQRCELTARQFYETPFPVIAHRAVGPFAIGFIDEGGWLGWKSPRRYVVPSS